MIRTRIGFAVALIGLFTAAPLVRTPAAQGPAATATWLSGAAAGTAGNVRDLSAVSPETVGISSERLRRIDTAMKRLVDEQQVAGLVTLLERHGKVVHFSSVGKLDAQKPDPLQK